MTIPPKLNMRHERRKLFSEAQNKCARVSIAIRTPNSNYLQESSLNFSALTREQALENCAKLINTHFDLLTDASKGINHVPTKIALVPQKRGSDEIY